MFCTCVDCSLCNSNHCDPLTALLSLVEWLLQCRRHTQQKPSIMNMNEGGPSLTSQAVISSVWKWYIHHMIRTISKCTTQLDDWSWRFCLKWKGLPSPRGLPLSAVSFECIIPRSTPWFLSSVLSFFQVEIFSLNSLQWKYMYQKKELFSVGTQSKDAKIQKMPTEIKHKI